MQESQRSCFLLLLSACYSFSKLPAAFAVPSSQHFDAHCEPLPSNVEDGFLHILTMKASIYEAHPLHWVYRMGLTRAHVYIYHRIPGQPLGRTQGACNMTVVQHELLPNIGRDALVFIKHMIDHYHTMPRALILAHSHGPTSWHMQPAFFFTRARAYYRGLVGTDLRFKPMLKMPITLSGGCSAAAPAQGLSGIECCSRYLCTLTAETDMCPLQGQLNPADGSSCEVKPALKAFMDDAFVNGTARRKAFMQHVGQLAPPHGLHDRHMLGGHAWQPSQQQQQQQQQQQHQHQHQQQHQHQHQQQQHAPQGRRRVLQDKYPEAVKTCNTIKSKYPFAHGQDAKEPWDFWSCCVSMVLGRSLVLQRPLDYYQALYDALDHVHAEQDAFDQSFTRLCFEYHSYNIWAPTELVSLHDMATYLLADFDTHTPSHG